MTTDASGETLKEINVWRNKLQDQIEAFYLQLFDEVAESGLPEGTMARLSQALLRAKQESIKEIQK